VSLTTVNPVAIPRTSPVPGAARRDVASDSAATAGLTAQRPAADAMLAPMPDLSTAPSAGAAPVLPSLNLAGEGPVAQLFQGLLASAAELKASIAGWPDGGVSREERRGVAQHLVGMNDLAHYGSQHAGPADHASVHAYVQAERQVFFAFSEANDGPHGEGNRPFELALTTAIGKARKACEASPEDATALNHLYVLERERLHC
jgi:hypothetical protein